MVVNTIPAKASAAGPGTIDIRFPNWISATSTPTTNTSTIDQRPTSSVRRYSSVFRWIEVDQRNWTDRHNQMRMRILPTGTSTLATKMMVAMGYEPWCHRVKTPPMMVLPRGLPMRLVYMMGRKLAGR
jgi:hypothetical protein